jgi:hypothetical protein
MSLEAYKSFVTGKTHLQGDFGFKPIYENRHAFDFQNALIEWALQKVGPRRSRTLASARH